MTVTAYWTHTSGEIGRYLRGRAGDRHLRWEFPYKVSKFNSAPTVVGRLGGRPWRKRGGRDDWLLCGVHPVCLVCSIE